jgi:hypothetical protein
MPLAAQPALASKLCCVPVATSPRPLAPSLPAALERLPAVVVEARLAARRASVGGAVLALRLRLAVQVPGRLELQLGAALVGRQRRSRTSLPLSWNSWSSVVTRRGRSPASGRPLHLAPLRAVGGERALDAARGGLLGDLAHRAALPERLALPASPRSKRAAPSRTPLPP